MHLRTQPLSCAPPQQHLHNLSPTWLCIANLPVSRHAWCSSHHIHNNDRQPCLIKRCKCSALPTATCTALQIGTYLCRASDPAQHPDTQDAAANNRHICVSNHVSRATRLLAREVHYAGLAGRCLKPPPVPLGTVASSCAGTCLSAQAQHRAQWTARQQLYTLQLSMNGERSPGEPNEPLIQKSTRQTPCGTRAAGCPALSAAACAG